MHNPTPFERAVAAVTSDVRRQVAEIMATVPADLYPPGAREALRMRVLSGLLAFRLTL